MKLKGPLVLYLTNLLLPKKKKEMYYKMLYFRIFLFKFVLEVHIC